MKNVMQKGKDKGGILKKTINKTAEGIMSQE
jgi:hypothetical protein